VKAPVLYTSIQHIMLSFIMSYYMLFMSVTIEQQDKVNEMEKKTTYQFCFNKEHKLNKQ